MALNTNIEKLKVAENLIFLRGEQGDIITANRDDCDFLHVENGEAFLELLNKAKSNGVGLLDEKLVELLYFHKIIVSGDKGHKKPPAGTETCGGTIGEQTLILPLAESVNEKVYEKTLSYVLKIIEDHGTLTIKFNGQDPLLSGRNVIQIAELINRKRKKFRPDVQLRYQLDTCLEKLSEYMVKWAGDNNVFFKIFFPLPDGLVTMTQQYDNFKDNMDKLSQANVQTFLVTPAVKGNICELSRIAEHHANLNKTGGFELPAIQNPSSWRTNGKKEDLPDPDQYAQALVDIYKARYVEDDLFTPVNELRHRVINRGYLAKCSCVYDHVTAVNAHGNIYPCLAALRLGCMCIGNAMRDPENNLGKAVDEFNAIRENSWGECNSCQWRGLCGMNCPLSNDSMNCGDDATYKELAKEYVCKPRVKLLTEIIRDLIKDAASTCSEM